MIDIELLADTVRLPSPPDGWCDYLHAPVMGNRLALVRVPFTYATAYQDWLESISTGDAAHPRPAPPIAEMQLSLFDGSTETEICTIGPVQSPLVDLLADGRWLVASTRAEDGERNGHIFSREGIEEGAIALGDGIAQLRCAPDGTIWVGYFDEGVFAPPGREDRRPVSNGGIVQFDTAGTMLWSFNDEVGARLPCYECSALSLDGDTVWACTLSDLPICRIEGRQLTCWSGDFEAADAIGTRGDAVVLVAAVGRNAGRIMALRLEGAEARRLGHTALVPQRTGTSDLIDARDGIVHIVKDGLWRRIPVDRLAQEIVRAGTDADMLQAGSVTVIPILSATAEAPQSPPNEEILAFFRLSR